VSYTSSECIGPARPRTAFKVDKALISIEGLCSLLRPCRENRVAFCRNRECHGLFQLERDSLLMDRGERLMTIPVWVRSPR